jgi:hypothetical protein
VIRPVVTKAPACRFRAFHHNQVNGERHLVVDYDHAEWPKITQNFMIMRVRTPRLCRQPGTPFIQPAVHLMGQLIPADWPLQRADREPINLRHSPSWSYRPRRNLVSEVALIETGSFESDLSRESA